MAVARGDEPADVVVRGGRVLSVFTREWLDADVAIRDGHVVAVGAGYEGRTTIDAKGALVVPGFIDAHMHLESSKLTVDQFARAVVPRGTTTVVADPHEIANVLGTDGVHWLLDSCSKLPLDVFVMASSCVPASPLESPRRPFTTGDLAGLLRRKNVIGIAEMMNFPAVVNGEEAELDKLRTGLTDHVDGHAPRLTGPALNAYLAAGIRSDHEATTAAEALEKRRLGMWVMLREASNARNLVDLLPMVQAHGPERCMFCTDDREPNFIRDHGHVNQMVRTAVDHGIAPETAIVMATINPAQYHRLWRHGAVAPGVQADRVLLDGLETFEPVSVLKRGAQPVYPTIEVPEWVRQTMHVGDLDEAAFALQVAEGAAVRAIGLVPGPLITTAEELRYPAPDLLKLAVIERHHATGRVGVGFATNVGLSRGAFASTVAHDAHNLVVLGADDPSMLACARRLAEIGGGIAIAEDGRVVDELALPVAGLMSTEPLDAVAARLDSMEARLAAMGSTIPSPFMALSFLALSVIPELKLTDRGLVDVGSFEVVPLTIS